MNKYEIAKDITIALLSDKDSICNGDSKTVSPINDLLADNVATFYNKLVEKLNIPD